MPVLRHAACHDYYATPRLIITLIRRLMLLPHATLLLLLFRHFSLSDAAIFHYAVAAAALMPMPRLRHAAATPCATAHATRRRLMLPCHLRYRR